MTDQQGQGDIDPVSQFSDPSLIHSYAENSQPPGRRGQPPPTVSPPASLRRSGRGLILILVLLVLAVVVAILITSLTR